MYTGRALSPGTDKSDWCYGLLPDSAPDWGHWPHNSDLSDIHVYTNCIKQKKVSRIIADKSLYKHSFD